MIVSEVRAATVRTFQITTALPRMPADLARAWDRWLTHVGIPYRNVPLGSTISVTAEANGMTVVEWEEFVLDRDGKRFPYPGTLDPATRAMIAVPPWRQTVPGFPDTPPEYGVVTQPRGRHCSEQVSGEHVGPTVVVTWSSKPEGGKHRAPGGWVPPVGSPERDRIDQIAVRWGVLPSRLKVH